MPWLHDASAIRFDVEADEVRSQLVIATSILRDCSISSDPTQAPRRDGDAAERSCIPRRSTPESFDKPAAPYDTSGTIRIAVLDDYIGCAEEFGDWAALGDDVEVVFYRKAISPAHLARELADYDILAITQQRAWLTREVLEQLPKLKLIVTNGSTSSVVDHDARRERGILLCGIVDPDGATSSNASGSSLTTSPSATSGIAPPAEMAWALIFAITKRVGIEDRAIRKGGWQTGFPYTLKGRTLGLAGLGNLGG